MTNVEAATSAAEAAKAEANLWTSRRQEVEQRAHAIADELIEVAGKLTAARKAALEGQSDPKAAAALAERRRALEDEQTELAETLSLAKEAESEAASAHRRLAHSADVAALKANAAADAARAAKIEAEIDRTFGELCALLQARSDLEDGFLATARMTQQQDGNLAGQGLELVGGIAGSRFDWRRLPHAGDPHGRYSLPGSG